MMFVDIDHLVFFNKGDWTDIFETLDDIRKDSFCKGSDPDESWVAPAAVQSGSDLSNVVRRGTFRCGAVRNSNFTTSSGQVLLRTTAGGEDGLEESTDGAIVDWWDALAERAANTLGSSIDIEWRLFDTSQAALEALANGQVDAGCGYYAPDGKFSVGNDNEPLARGAAFSAQWCSTFLQTGYLYAPVAGDGTGIGTFEELIASIEAADTADTATICVDAGPDAGLVASCQSTFDSYVQNGNVVCSGVGPSQAFAQVLSGGCVAAYSFGSPGDGAVADLLSRFPQPTIFAPVSFFRRNDLNQQLQESTKYAPSSEENIFDKAPDFRRPNNNPTSLQLAVTRAFDDLVASGMYADVFGDLVDRDPMSFCTGSRSWPAQIPKPGSDLAKLLGRRKFRCGFGTDSYFTTSQGQVLIDTRGGTVEGVFPEYWALLLNKVGSYYGIDLSVEWEEYDNAQEILDALNRGEIDSACAFFSPDGLFTNPDGGRVARGLAFSKLYCPVFAEKGYIYTTEQSPIGSFDALIDNINGAAADTRICAVRGGVSGMNCASTFAIFASAPVRCTVVDSEEVPTSLASGDCDVVFAGTLPADLVANNDSNVTIVRFDQHYSNTPVSLFRTLDAESIPSSFATDDSPSSSSGTCGSYGFSNWILSTFSLIFAAALMA